ncbi:beta-2-glycoprotein 1-like [Takifugu flavidus]|uniref:beta-2-glycoprotein 1-like n=1 Tax=Takifugu flavidus TaxID=433684 RepID=UPI0025443C23|nr:beta-2-glycoprotein 1-like [Takifugu flavidus]
MERNLFLLTLVVGFITDGSGQDNVCTRPELNVNILLEGLQRYFNPGEELVLSCEPGYTPLSGPRKIICRVNGEWTKTKLLCIPKRCPYPESLLNGEVYYTDTVYGSTINYTCDEGYTMNGADVSECLSNGMWSNPAPECKAVQCGLAPIPQFGKIIYNKHVEGNTTSYGTQGTYQCLPPYVLFGDAKAECTSNGNWTKTPECRVVSCPPPENIERGYMSSNAKRTYDYTETIKYGCHGDHVIEGSQQIVCQKYGNWSERPSCKAPCSVGIRKGRILYRGRKLWIKELTPNRILHNELVSVYCMNNERKCGYAVSTQCIDGKLNIPECFQEPSLNTYNLHSSSLPSEIKQC